MAHESGGHLSTGQDSTWHPVFRVAHLGGGMRAICPPGPEVKFLPRLPNTPQGYTLSNYYDLHISLLRGGLHLVGIDFIRSRDGHVFPSDWRPLWPEPYRFIASDAEQLWSQLSTGAHDIDDNHLVDLCARIKFQIQSATWRLRDISDSYHRELASRFDDGEFKDGQRFESVNSFLIYLACHSFLEDMATLRDYLAEFVAKHVLSSFNTEGVDVRKMSSLRKTVLPRARGKHPIADKLCELTDEGGWLKELSTYRDLALHYTPLASAAGRSFLEQRILRPESGGEFPEVHFFLPGDPAGIRYMRSTGGLAKSAEEFLQKCITEGRAPINNGPDALEYAHRSLALMAYLAISIGELAPVKPKMVHLGPEDLRGPVRVRYA